MKRKVDPLVAQGHKVFLSYDGEGFVARTRTSKAGWSYVVPRSPNPELRAWLIETAGPRGILWTTEKDKSGEGLNIYFYRPNHALMAKLRWGGK